MLKSNAPFSIPKTAPAALFRKPKSNISINFCNTLPTKITAKTTTIKVAINDKAARYFSSIEKYSVSKLAA